MCCHIRYFIGKNEPNNKKLQGTTVYCHIRYFNDYSWIAPADKMRYEWMQHPNYYVTYTHTVRVLKTKQHPNYYFRIVVPHA